MSRSSRIRLGSPRRAWRRRIVPVPYSTNRDPANRCVQGCPARLVDPDRRTPSWAIPFCALRYAARPAMLSPHRLPPVTQTPACWLWTGYRLDGYGRFGRRDGDIVYAHRFAWEEAFGAVPTGLCVLHRCDTPACVRPSHLFLGTKAENTRDMIAKGRRYDRAARVCAACGSSLTTAKACKLCASCVVRIKYLSAAHGIAAEHIATCFGVTPRTVRLIREGSRWRSIQSGAYV